MVKELTGYYNVQYHANGVDNPPIEIGFTPSFTWINMIQGLEDNADLNILPCRPAGKPPIEIVSRLRSRGSTWSRLEEMTDLNIPEDLSTDKANRYLMEACARHDFTCPLVGHFLEETCVNPTFIVNHPEIMSLLAKSHRDEARPVLTKRFELFINKHEVWNAYTELNDPVLQRQRFEEQLRDWRHDDDEAMAMDETLCSVLEYGLPPTGGLGLGINCLTMLLTDSQNIKEVLLFPAMKPRDN
ncbi:hypothetical protein VPH35_049459 [Triticum aestivum]